MSRITQRGQGGALPLQSGGTFQQSTDSSLLTLLGSRWDLEDGREVKLVLAGASNLASGKVMTAVAPVANHQNLTVTAVQAYSANGNVPATVTVTLGGTAATLNQYQLGYAVVTSGTGLGQTLQIASNPAQATTTGALVVTLADAPNTALDTSSKISLLPNPCANVIVSVAAALQQPVGITLYPITAASYGYVVSKGITSCLNDGGLTTGGAVSVSNGVAGAVENGVIAQGFVGFAVVAGTDTQYQPIFVNL